MIDSFTGEYRFLSNFYPVQLTVNGQVYATVEHAFQALKTTDLAWAAKIQRAPTPGEAKRLGRQAPLRPDWETKKNAVMLALVRAKFSYPGLAKKLKETGSQPLVEGNSWGDRYWGRCQGVGQNRLGLILMKVREEL